MRMRIRLFQTKLATSDALNRVMKTFEGRDLRKLFSDDAASQEV